MATSGLLLVDKERGMTSHDVVALARRALQTKAVGHAGTLDPMATGLLILGVGEGTKLLRYLSGDGKRYRATVSLGAQTSTWDAEGEVVERGPIPNLVVADVQTVAQRFVGTFMQQPPAVSAIKQGGEPLYKKVRRGEVVTAPLREVTVRELAVCAAFNDSIELTVAASTGFYVRSLACDLARTLGTVGHLSYLRRERSGVFDVQETLPSALLSAARSGDRAAQEHVQSAVIPLAGALARVLPQVIVDEEGAAHARHGRPFAPAHIERASTDHLGSGPVGVFDSAGTPLAIGHLRDEQWCITRGFVLPLKPSLTHRL